MNRFWNRIVITAAFGMAALCPSVGAEVEVSVTLSGPVSEILPILELLKDLGVGVGNNAGGSATVEVHSAYSDSEDSAAETTDPAPAEPKMEAPAPEPEAEPEMPAGPSFSNFQATPESVTVGQQLFVSVTLNDPEGAVDTVAFNVGELEGTTADLYDNGSNGDKVAGDGVWSLAVPVPDLPSQKYTLNLSGFDAFAQPVQLETADGPVPLQARTQVEVVD